MEKINGFHSTLFLMVFFFSIAMGVEAQAVQVQLEWDYSDQRTDSTTLPESEIIRTDIWCNSSVVASVPAPETSTVIDLSPGTYDCAPELIATRYTDGSGEVGSGIGAISRIVVPGEYAPPEPPSGLIWQLLLAFVEFLQELFA